jgi:hypothetical protein
MTMPWDYETGTPDEIRQFIRYSLKIALTAEPLFYYAEKQYRATPTYDKAFALYFVFVDDANAQFGQCHINTTAALKTQIHNPIYVANPDALHFRPIATNKNAIKDPLTRLAAQWEWWKNGGAGRAPAQATTWRLALKKAFRPGSNSALPSQFLPAKEALRKAGFNMRALGLA